MENRSGALHTPDMSLPAVLPGASSPTGNVRLVAVDDADRPRYLQRALVLHRAIVSVAAGLGVQPEDIPGLQGLCIEAVRAAERHDR